MRLKKLQCPFSGPDVLPITLPSPACGRGRKEPHYPSGILKLHEAAGATEVATTDSAENRSGLAITQLPGYRSLLMVRPLRVVEFPGGVSYVTSWGDGREAIFLREMSLSLTGPRCNRECQASIPPQDNHFYRVPNLQGLK